MFFIHGKKIHFYPFFKVPFRTCSFLLLLEWRSWNGIFTHASVLATSAELALHAGELSPLPRNLQHSSSRSQKLKLTEEIIFTQILWRPHARAAFQMQTGWPMVSRFNVFVGGVRVQVGGPRTNTENAETGPKATAEWRETQAGFQSRVICLKPSAQV